MQQYDEALHLYYEIKDKDGESYAVITDADKKLAEVDIPGEIGGSKVRKVARKAFLSCKGLRRVSIPESVTEIGEWAFAFCDDLLSVGFIRGDISLGKGVFKNDGKLREITVRNQGVQEDDSEGDIKTARLLAATPELMDAEYLLDIKHAGSKEWLKKWDTRLEHILSLRDDEGYHLYVLCGEEDLHFDYEEYLEYNREKKSELCMLRLVNDIALNDKDRDILVHYIKDHMSGCESEAALRVLLERHGDEKDYYSLMLDTGAINDENLEAVLNAMGNRHAQMKAYLMEKCNASKDDYFDDLML
ncbi:MAG: leucine-rich repeat domain-containing protein [Lachnospiraceae bacterium]|nr:leucine-rich repeat domain-containing protein [Lachnospiraceae bacterium]